MSLPVGHRLNIAVDRHVMQEEPIFYPDNIKCSRCSKPIDTAMGILKELNPELICRAALLTVAEEGEEL